MPFSFQIYEALDLIVVEADGVLTPETLRDCVNGYMDHSAFHPGMDVLIRIDGEITVEINGEEASPVVLAQENPLGDTRRLVARHRGEKAARAEDPAHPSEELGYRMACAGGSVRGRTLTMSAVGLMTDQADMAAFEELPDALKWLGKEEALDRLGRE